MSTTDWKRTAELIGIGAIVASLIFVGLEMRQTRKLAMAAAYQARTDSEMSIDFALLQSDRFQQIRENVLTDQPISPSDQRFLNSL